MDRILQPNLFALGAITLWASLATLGVSLTTIPPFLLTGLALAIGSMPSWPAFRQWRVPPSTLAIGIGGLFGYHFLLFIALRNAPPVQANLLNYLWPLLIVLLAPLIVPGLKLRSAHIAAAVVGFTGAVLAITSGASGAGGEAGEGAHAAGGASLLAGAWHWGYLPALGAALTWALYSLATRRLEANGQGFPTAAVGGFCLASGLLSLACHAVLEPRIVPSASDLGLIAVLGLGPMGAAFYLWDRALKHGDPRTIGVLSYLTPLASTALLVLFTGAAPTGRLILAAVAITAAAVIALNADRRS